MEETSNDGSSSGLAFVDREFKGKIKYQPRSQEEIAAALAVVEVTTREGSNHGSITGSETGLSPTDGASIEGPTPDHIRPKSAEKAWDYFRPTSVQNSSGNTMWECVFCDYEGTRNVTHFKRHLVHACPGVPDEVRSQIRAQGKTGQKWKRRIKEQSARRVRPKWMDEMTEESEDGADDDVDANDKAVEILTKLFTTKEKFDLPEEYDKGVGTNPGGGGAKSGAKGSLLHLTDTEMEREMKELKVKRMRAEVRKLEEETAHAGLTKKKVEIEIEEGKERSQFFKRLNSNLDKLISLANCVLINSDSSVRESILSAVRNQATGSSSILQEAFSETINGD